METLGRFKLKTNPRPRAGAEEPDPFVATVACLRVHNVLGLKPLPCQPHPHTSGLPLPHKSPAFISFKYILTMGMCLWGHMCTCVSYHEAKRGCRIPQRWSYRCCESPDVGAENRTQVLRKSNSCFSLLSGISSRISAFLGQLCKKPV